MKDLVRVFCCIFLLTVNEKQNTASISFDKKDAVVWLQKQTVSGKLSGFQSKQLTVHHDDTLFYVSVNNDSSFSFDINLHDAENKIWLAVDNEKSLTVSDTLHLTLGYHPLPVVKPYAVVTDN